jgi:hypothetical protein
MQELQAEDYHYHEPKNSIPAQTKYFKSSLCYSLCFWFYRRTQNVANRSTFNVTVEVKLTWILLAHFFYQIVLFFLNHYVSEFPHPPTQQGAGLF